MIQMYFGKACKEYREEMNISQEKFALSIGMDRTYYSSVEAGKRNVSIQNIKKIADGYPHEFQYKIFDDLSGYDTVGDLYNVIRKELITKGELFSDYNSPEYDFNDKVFLLDSGAASIVKQVAVDIKYDKGIVLFVFNKPKDIFIARSESFVG